MDNQEQNYQSAPQGGQYQQMPPPKRKNGLGTAALVVGIIAIVGSWIPFFNVISLVLGIVALGLAIGGLLMSRKGRPKGTSIAGLILAAITIIIFVAMYGTAAAVVDNAFDQALDEAVEDLQSTQEELTQEEPVVEEPVVEEPVAEEPPAEEPPAVEPPAEEPATAETSGSGDADWKQFLDEYEAWVDEYVAFMKKYNENPSDLDLLTDYTSLMEQSAEWTEKTMAMEDSLSAAEAAEYSSRLLKISAKMLKALS
jgi:hypothetical protein